ncbi:hypothetical protein C8R45DRAFT_932376 [Mycena sanguinolenta]|nr:hypothetical protein C8R45DRAFT_932376 [Mycena sanguinolenta]
MKMLSLRAHRLEFLPSKYEYGGTSALPVPAELAREGDAATPVANVGSLVHPAEEEHIDAEGDSMACGKSPMGGDRDVGKAALAQYAAADSAHSRCRARRSSHPAWRGTAQHHPLRAEMDAPPSLASSTSRIPSTRSTCCLPVTTPSRPTRFALAQFAAANAARTAVMRTRPAALRIPLLALPPHDTARRTSTQESTTYNTPAVLPTTSVFPSPSPTTRRTSTHTADAPVTTRHREKEKLKAEPTFPTLRSNLHSSFPPPWLLSLLAVSGPNLRGGKVKEVRKRKDRTSKANTHTRAVQRDADAAEKCGPIPVAGASGTSTQPRRHRSSSKTPCARAARRGGKEREESEERGKGPQSRRGERDEEGRRVRVQGGLPSSSSHRSTPSSSRPSTPRENAALNDTQVQRVSSHKQAKGDDTNDRKERKSGNSKTEKLTAPTTVAHPSRLHAQSPRSSTISRKVLDNTLRRSRPDCTSGYRRGRERRRATAESRRYRFLVPPGFGRQRSRLWGASALTKEREGGRRQRPPRQPSLRQRPERGRKRRFSEDIHFISIGLDRCRGAKAYRDTLQAKGGRGNERKAKGKGKQTYPAKNVHPHVPYAASRSLRCSGGTTPHVEGRRTRGLWQSSERIVNRGGGDGEEGGRDALNAVERPYPPSMAASFFVMMRSAVEGAYVTTRRLDDAAQQQNDGVEGASEGEDDCEDG